MAAFFYSVKFKNPLTKINIFGNNNFIKKMKKTLLFSILTIFLLGNGYAQSSLWKKTSAKELSALPKVDRDSQPMKSEIFTLDYEGLKAQLRLAPSRNSGQHSDVVVQFPGSDGKLSSYRIYEASVMHPELAARYPQLQSYVGQGVDDPVATIRLTTTTFGLHVMAFTAKGTSYIDPYTKNLKSYIVYDKNQLMSSRARQCEVAEELSEADAPRLLETAALASDGRFRTYRLAMACTTEYADFHISQAGLTGAGVAAQRAAVLAAMTVTVARIDAVYERDMSLTLQLVANNDLVVFVGTDPFSDTANDTASQLINQSQTYIDQYIGSANYDIGHTVSTGGGGLAQLGSVCTASKARGITGSPAPVGDPFDIDFVAHEVGHQFGGSHTFNGTTAATDGNCTSGTRSPGQAVEPGSGTTVMAYAGICGVQDVQGNSDDYFHAVSIAQMMAHITGAGNCVPGVANGNAAPVANAGLDYLIPKSTPFVLRASATDANGDAMTYVWEQLENQTIGVTQPPVATSIAGPNFRSRPPSVSPNRYFPNLPTIVGNLQAKWEVLPSVSRVMNFALTVRDNRAPNGGQTGRDDMKVTTVAAAGPFVVTSQNTDQLVLVPGSTQTVTWDVAGTTGNGINTANVKISFSTDNGVTFSTVLLASTPNDGSEVITLPNVTAPNCRIMVEAVGNIFFAINSKNIALGDYTYTSENVCTDYPFTINAPITESADNTYPGYQFTIPDSYTITDFNFNSNVTHPAIGQVNILIMAPWQTALNTAIWYDNTACTGANLNKWFDTSGSAVNCATTNDGGNFLPYSITNINSYNGNNSAGVWRIYFKDVVVDANNANASFNSLTFQLCRTESVPQLGVQNYGLEDFAIYPNPNNGEFNVKFNSSSSNNIKVSLHDIQGRRIFDKSFDNTGLFDQRVKLNNVQAGIYLVTVQDGPTKEVRRIVVE